MKREITNPAQERLYGDDNFGYGGPIVANDRNNAIRFKTKFPNYTVYFKEGKKKFEMILNEKETEAIEIKDFDFTNPIDKIIYGENYKKDK